MDPHPLTPCQIQLFFYSRFLPKPFPSHIQLLEESESHTLELFNRGFTNCAHPVSPAESYHLIPKITILFDGLQWAHHASILSLRRVPWEATPRFLLRLHLHTQRGLPLPQTFQVQLKAVPSHCGPIPGVGWLSVPPIIPMAHFYSPL